MDDDLEMGDDLRDCADSDTSSVELEEDPKYSLRARKCKTKRQGDRETDGYTAGVGLSLFAHSVRSRENAAAVSCLRRCSARLGSDTDGSKSTITSKV